MIKGCYSIVSFTLRTLYLSTLLTELQAYSRNNNKTIPII